MLNLLPTKLYIPTTRPGLINRPRLLHKLTSLPATKLILISAPAGYGKTTLATAWLHHLQSTTHIHICWLSLNQNDSDPQQFFRYLAAAIHSLPDVQTQLSQLLQASQPLPTNTLISAFIHDVAAVSTPFILLLDDYHALDSADIDHALTTLLDHMPPHMTLALTSRTDPGFPLSRLRARGQLIELRADELRFTTDETAAFLQDTMGIQLTADQIAALENRTEGWIAGLQMAALSLQNRSGRDRDTFVQTFTGSHRFIIDYLAEETLAQQPESIRDFLLATAILERLSGPLCDAVTGRSDSQTLLEQLDHNNLFLVPLDDERRWYRYHHLFADVLQTYGRTQHPDQRTTWHQRAADWLASHNSISRAIHHALAAQDFERTAAITERAWRSMDRSFQEATWLSWVEQVPDELIRLRPVLSAGYAWALLDTGQFTAAESYLQNAEQWLAAPSAEMVITDQAEFNALPGTIAAARTYLAQAHGDLAATEHYAQQALQLIPQDDPFYRGIPTVTLGIAQWTHGDLTAAADSFTKAIANFQQADNLLFAISGLAVLAEIKAIQGHLHEAAAIYEQSIQLITTNNHLLFRPLMNLHRGLSELKNEQGDLEAARQHMQKIEELNEQAGGLEYDHRYYITLAQIKTATGNLTDALAQLDKAEVVYKRGRMADAISIAAAKSRIWIAQNQLTAAWQWANTHNISAEDDLTFSREFAHLTLARLLLAQYRSDQAQAPLHAAETLLARLESAAAAGNRTSRLIEALLLQALLKEAQGDIPAALIPLERALTLAKPESYLCLFVNEGTPMFTILQAAVQQDIAPLFTARLLSAYKEKGAEPAASQPLIDPLSDRELEILTLIAAGLKNQDIADQLYISLNTVLYHNKNIYSKLGVNKRTQAAAKARELNLI